MKAFLRRFGYVRGLEARIAELEQEAARKEAAMASMNRYIEQLEMLKNFQQEEIKELKRHLSGYRP
jgi:uncharacterized coiled-coil protein SlyX|uniref:Uncharacterized protein n=1 Tax=Gracilinema caldarium TaxID=215591 RepID=A0A7C3IIQ8_9SPIR